MYLTAISRVELFVAMNVRILVVIENPIGVVMAVGKACEATALDGVGDLDWGLGWSGFGSSTGETPSGDSQNGAVDSSNANSMVAKFLMEELSIPNVEKLMENAQRKLMGSNSCWQNDYRNLFAGCAEILAVAEKRSRFTWHLSDCFQRDSGRSPFPHCDERSSTADCRKKLDPTEGTEIENLRIEANDIEKEIANVRDNLFSKTETLQGKADDIGNMAGASLEKQRQLLDGQSTALDGLQFLTEFQSEALTESRLSSCALSIFIISMFTSTKQTYNVRPWLYIELYIDEDGFSTGLCITFFIEVLVLRFTTLNIEEQAKILTFFRLLFAFLASAQLLHAIFTYRRISFHVNQTATGIGLRWSSWIDSDLPDVLDTSEDPDFDVSRDVGESSLATSVRKYDPCRRLR
ncbi:hypothetical protein CRG98_011597 [Punica granatum]|uniref:Uncharacterized protein n=1 Tax=Punica granatum TaxID=22663 RepID=A0A2I0KHR7_PUNGR|nr:hypothetical protein CRG98_011597 [Punica granatum]